MVRVARNELEREQVRGAVEEAWHALRFAFDSPQQQGAAAVRRRLARAVLAGRAQGRRHRPDLVTYALGQLDPLPAKWARPEDARYWDW